MQRLQVQVDELLVEFGTLLPHLMDDVLEVTNADVPADRFEVRHHFLTRQRLDFVQIGSKDLHHMPSDQRVAGLRTEMQSEQYTSRPASVSWVKTQREASKITARCSAPSFCKYRTVGPAFSSGSSSSALILERGASSQEQKFSHRKMRGEITYRLRSSTAFSCMFLPL